jgi:hypothetical protein
LSTLPLFVIFFIDAESKQAGRQNHKKQGQKAQDQDSQTQNTQISQAFEVGIFHMSCLGYPWLRRFSRLL